nr:hypothetical protein [Roseateles chitosanitabidus]
MPVNGDQRLNAHDLRAGLKPSEYLQLWLFAGDTPTRLASHDENVARDDSLELLGLVIEDESAPYLWVFAKELLDGLCFLTWGRNVDEAIPERFEKVLDVVERELLPPG